MPITTALLVKNKPPARFFFRWLVALLLAPLAWGYDISRYNGQPVTLNPGTVSINIQLGSATVLSDGSTYNSSVKTALQAWNSQLGTVQFSNQIAVATAPIDHNGINEIGFDSTVYGTAFDANVLAITMSYHSTTPRTDGTYQRTQADIIFNNAYTWDSYRGPLRSAEDIQRVVLHELGHVLGLNHPDLASPPQNVTALMNSHVSDLDALASDDIAGAQFLYGAPNSAPSITSQPANQTVYAGQNAQFSISANGNPAPTFQWQRLSAGSGTWANLSNAGVYSGTSTTTLSISSAVTVMNGDQFRCVAANSVGPATSSPAVLTVNAAVLPVISGLPATVTLNYGDTLSLSPSVTGTQPITYQWKISGVNVSGATGSSYNKSNATPVDNGIYALIANNAAGPAVSSNVIVTVSPAIAPTITQQPVALSIAQGGAASFSALASGTNPIAYQWYFNGQLVIGETSTAVTIPNAQPINAGSYRVVITNPGGSITSDAASLSLSSMLGVISANAGGRSSVFIKTDGTLWDMGFNYYGQLGDGTNVNRSNQIPIVTGVVAIAEGYNYSLFIKTDLTLWGTGENEFGQLGDGTTANSNNPKLLATGIVGAAAGFENSLFIKSDGSLWGMGNNNIGQLGDGTTIDHISPELITNGAVAAFAGDYHSLFIKSDGTLWVMGNNYEGELGDGTNINRSSPVPIATGVVAAAAGSAHSLFIKSDGTLWAMGYNDNGQLGDGTTINRSSPVLIAGGVASVTAHGYQSLFIKSDGTLWAMGNNYYGQLGDGTTTSRSSPVLVATGVVTATAGYLHSLFIKSDGTLWAMGWNGTGALGDGTNITRYIPEQIVNGSITKPNVPVGVIAGNDNLVPQIRVTWSPIIGATSYEVWRSTTNNPASAIRVASNVPIALFYDLTAVSGANYFYWIKAVNSAGASNFSGSATNMLPPSNAVITITVE